ncbi:MAG: class I SAM-dependent methyltransferase family protein [Candidatus ainarchaeum sp.]|nr:class I SAM-dependent methyltransferase family protein [Candidatus ainarchaeum sp.]
MKINKTDAEKARKMIMELGIFENEYKVENKGKYVYFPIKKKISDIGEIVELKGNKSKRRRSIEEILGKVLEKKELENLVRSYDLIGSIAVIEIPKELEKKEKEIAKAIIEVHPNIKTVAKKMSAVSGEYRTRKIKIIQGKRTKETIHKEHGCSFKLNAEKVYYSVRLSGERERVKQLVKPGEKILALFAGVGPFPITIAKNNAECEIISVESNPIAVKYFKENIILNKIKNIKVVEGDAGKIAEKYPEWADRIIMPLPKDGEKFLKSAIKSAKDGCIIHFYTFVESEDPLKKAEEIAAGKFLESNTKFKVVSKRIVRSYSPKIVQVVLDLRVIKNK